MFLRCLFFVLVVLGSLVDGRSHEEFEDPPIEYRAKFRYWLPDASVPVEAVSRDIRAAKEAGAGGLEFLPFYLYGFGEVSASKEDAGVVPHLPDWSRYGFGTPAFVDLFKGSLEAAQDARILLDYALGANQAQGVPSDVSTPGLAVELLMGQVEVSPHGQFDGPLPPAEQPFDFILNGLGFQHPLEQFGTPNLTAVMAYRVLNNTGIGTVHLDEKTFIDLSPLVRSNHTLRWSPPTTDNTWRVFSFWEAYTNQRSCDGGLNATNFLGNGSWTVDHFSKKGASRVTDFWDQYILSDKQVASLLRSVGNYAWEDSMEMMSSLYWTPNLLQRFKNQNGYDLLPYLPLLFSKTNSWGGLVPSYNETFEFGSYLPDGDSVHQLDYRKALNQGYQEYLSHFQNWTHSIGNEYSAQPAYNLPLQAVSDDPKVEMARPNAAKLSDIPMIDAPEGESLGFSEMPDVYRQFTGPAHLADKKVISTEIGAVNTPPYWLTVPNLLQKIKLSFAGGFTMNVIHGFPTLTSYANTTWPGYTPFNYDFTDMWNPIQPAWKHLKDSLDFIGRNQWVLQQGQPRVDLAFYAYASPWSIVQRYNSDDLRNWGYTYDYLGPDNLASSYAFMKNKKLGIPQYQAVIIYNQTIATSEAIDSLIQFAYQGLKVVFVGTPPNQSYPLDASSRTRFKSSMELLLKGPNVIFTSSINDLPVLLQENGIKPRVSSNCTSSAVYTVYRSTADVDYLYIYNDHNGTSRCGLTIAATGVVPSIYDAWTGSQAPLLQYSSSDSQISVNPKLKANETLILALQRNVSQPICTLPQWSPYIRSVTASGSHLQAIVTHSPCTLATPTGKVTYFNTTLPPPTNLSTWQLAVEDWHSARDRFAIQNEITNHTFNNVSLVPWHQISASLQPVSGIGRYTVNFGLPSGADSPPIVGYLNLPPIQHTARVYVNDKWLGPIDPVNPVIMLRGLEKGKVYELRIDVSTTLFNRVKAEADLVWMIGKVASKVAPNYGTMPYEKYGLVGSVFIEWGYAVDVEC